ncbi:MAG TPA: DUF6600 domain-containing protein [Thermoanaerobaculaceae bacterium]|nr:DUF6600 domain-containing protein [Thermoanaerobaculaceae bacterium]
MKTRVLTLILTAALLFVGVPKRADAYVGVSVGFFYNELAPYGRWVDSAYGYAWVPPVGAGWQPYEDGQWIWTVYGWTWVSFDLWPDDPFHFGCWYWDDDWGWAWVPGTVWGPAWVTWCYDADFIGWAPLPPTFAFAAYGYRGRPVVVPESRYVFVPGNRFVGASIAGVRVPVSRNPALLQRGRSVTGFSVAGGVVANTALPLRQVQAAVGRTIPVRSISAARTDPRPLPRVSSARLTVAASPAVVRAQLAGRRIAAGVRRVVSTPPGRGPRILVTNDGGGKGRTTTTRGPASVSRLSSRMVRRPSASRAWSEPPSRTFVRSAPAPHGSAWAPVRRLRWDATARRASPHVVSPQPRSFARPARAWAAAPSPVLPRRTPPPRRRP